MRMLKGRPRCFVVVNRKQRTAVTDFNIYESSLLTFHTELGYLAYAYSKRHASVFTGAS